MSKKVKTMIYSGENDWHEYIIGNLVRETIHVRDYETTELSVISWTVFYSILPSITNQKNIKFC